MRQVFYLIITVLLIISCKDDKRVVEQINFETKYKLSSVIEDETEKDTLSWKYQKSAADYANKGDYKNALIHWDLAMGSSGKTKSFSKEQVDSIHNKYKKINASNYIVERAKENKVVIINEAHHSSHHRTFTKSLLKKLFDNGYTNLGLEALTNNDSLMAILNNRKYPAINTGHYIKDPQFGDFVREALEIGYTLFAYENMSVGSGKPREIAQATNIKKIMDSKPNEKFLIHCGFSHVLEGEVKGWEKAMAGRLKEYTGINPLTINQTKYSETSKPELNNPFLEALNLEESSILLDKDNQPLNYSRGESYADLVVFHPNTEYINGRPNWLFKNGNKNASVELSDLEIEFPVMFLAFKKGEDINIAVPIDITEVKTKISNCNLGLKKGDYVIVATNGKQSLKFEQQVK